MLAPATIGVEVLDDPDADPALVRRMLTDITRTNRWLGGAHAVRVGLKHLLHSVPPGTSLRLLDVGTGAGDLPRAAAHYCETVHVNLQGVGIERPREAARLAHEQGLPTVVACGSALPFGPATGDRRQATTATASWSRHASPVTRRCCDVDIVLISQLLHHFDDDAAVELIREAARVARLGVILTDLRPMHGAAQGFRLAGLVLGLHRVTVTDGVVSMARGRPARTLAHLAHRAGATELLAHDLPLARVVVAFRTRQ